MNRPLSRYSRRTSLLLTLVGACSSSFEPVPLGWGPLRVYPTHRETDLGFRSADGVILAGTLILPRDSGQYAGLVMHFGSDRWHRTSYERVAGWLALGVAVFTYDKRG